ncbi:N-alpha-acetyltransferase 40 [Neocloeon triangulifer]|uniref:N-alpha-acetyltransferase 40 n=1 Tax=Neocloeon triangulifer TaxID=2078957 RepID=UPI00286F6416|nr:N-alpha-acetyltransferase 40 [Neocloeon triangulifer]
MGKSSKKCKENRQQRKEEIAKIAKTQGILNAAKKQDDPMANLQPFSKFSKDGLDVTISFSKVDDLDEIAKEKVLDLMRTNMKETYESCDWGWNEKEKYDELFDEDARYILAKGDDGSLVAFSHFRFDFDEGRPVLYCYELQLSETARRKGLGRRMMQILEMFAWQANMERVVLTILKNNPGAKSFFLSMKYELDETNPEDDDEETFCYEILSKQRKIKTVE